MEHVIVILIMLLLKKIIHMKREGAIDATSKDAPTFVKWMEFAESMVHQRNSEDHAATRDVGTLDGGYVQNVHLPRVPRLQSASLMTSKTRIQDICYSKAPGVPR
jgi:hypothetical protein